MGESTIFSPQAQSLPSPVPQVSEQAVTSSPKPMLQQAPPPFKKGFPFGKLLKITGVLIVCITIVFLFYYFILPRFTKSESPKDVTITYWGLWESESVMKAIFADFEKNNPHIKVVYEKQNNKEYRDRLNARLQNGTGPDVFLFHNSWLPQASSNLLPLPGDVIEKSEFEKSFYPVMVKDLTKNGGIYGIPFGFDTLSLFINTEIFKQAGVLAPTNWQDFSKIARQVTVKDGSGSIKTAGAALGTFDNITHAPDVIAMLFAQNGANFKDVENTSHVMVDTLDFYTSFAKDEGSVWDSRLDPSILAFAKGNVAMYFGYSWDIFTIRTISPDFVFEVVPVPNLSGRNITVASYWASGASVKSKNQKETLALLKFLSQKETMQKLFSESSKTRLFGELYPRRDLADLLKDNSLVYPFISQGMGATSSFFASDTFDNGLNGQMNGYLGNAVRSVLSGTSSESAVETLTKGVAQVLLQYGQP